MNVSPMILRFSLGLDDVVERREEVIARLHVHEVDLELAPERVFDLPGLVLPEHSGVDEDADELIADRLVHQRGGDGGIDPAGQPADDALGADLRADVGDPRSMIDVFVHVGRHSHTSKRNAFSTS